METSSAPPTRRTSDTFPEIQLHTISSASDWPLAVRSITSLLSEPLPRWVCRGPYPPTAPFAAYLIPELEAQTLATAAACSTDDNHTSLRLKETYNLIMSSCADLQTLASRSPMEPVFTKTITFGLVASLFRSFAEELSPRKYCKFVDGKMAEFLLVLTVTNDDLAVSEEKLLPFLRSGPDQEYTTSDIDVSGHPIVIDGDSDGGVIDEAADDTGDANDSDVPDTDLDVRDDEDEDALNEDEEEDALDEEEDALDEEEDALDEEEDALDEEEDALDEEEDALDEEEDALDEEEDALNEDEDALNEEEDIFDDLDTSEDDTSELTDSSEVDDIRGSSWYGQGFFSESDGRTVRSCLSTQPSQASLEVPEHAHILESSRPRAWVDIPVVCVAEAIDMPSVMSKVLYQRQIWGVKEPVIGIITSNRGLTVRVAIGWVEENETTVHVATSSGNSSDTCLGEYNLLNPFECMHFARFILGLERPVKSMSSSLLGGAKGSVYPSWSWTPDKSRTSIRGNIYIEQWRREVAQATDTLVESLSGTSCMGEHEDPAMMAPKSTIAKAQTAVDKPDPFLDSARQIGVAQTETVDSEAGTSASTISETEATHTTRMSNSKRCKRGDLSNKKGGTVIESLLDRNIYIIPHVGLNVKTNRKTTAHIKVFAPFIARIVSTYRSGTEPRAPNWIKDEKTIASSDVFVEKYYQELCDDANLKTLHKALGSTEEVSLRDRLPSLAQCCDLARIRDDLDDTRGANKAERRQVWDMIAVITYLVTQSQFGNSIDIVLERCLNFPSNPAVKDLEKYKSDELEHIGQYTDRLCELRDLCFELELAARQSELAIENSYRCVAQCWAWADVIKALHDRAFGLYRMKSPTCSLYNIMRERCAREPFMGICDTALVVSCPNAGRMIHKTLFKALRKRDQDSKATDIFNLSVEMMEDFSLFVSPALSPNDSFEPALPPRRPPMGPEKVENEKTRSSPTTSSELDEEFFDLLNQCIAAGKKDPNKNKAPTMGERVLRLDADLRLPLLTLEHADGCTMHEASNQSLACIAAVLQFFKLVGIYNVPLYSIVTNGTHGTLFASMYCRENGPDPTSSSTGLNSQALILKWNTKTYDVSSMADVYHLSAFIQRLAEGGEQLKERFTQDLLPSFIEKVEADPEILRWSIISRLPKEEKSKCKAKLVESFAKRRLAGIFQR